jgi:surface antigen
MTRALRQCALALMIGLAAFGVAAAGWGAVLGRGPAQDYSDEDLRLLLAALKQALDAPGEPQAVPWRNERSGAGGAFLVVGRPQVKGFEDCRRVRATLYSKKSKGQPAHWTSCKDADGHWRLVAAG